MRQRKSVERRLIVDTGNALFREADEQLPFLVVDRGFRREDEIGRWGTTVTFHSDAWTLYLFYGEREFDFTAEIKYHQFPRKNPKPLCAVFEAMGINCPWGGPQTRVDDARLHLLIAGIAQSITQHWEALSRAPTVENFCQVARILDRDARRIRKHDVI